MKTVGYKEEKIEFCVNETLWLFMLAEPQYFIGIPCT